jgi:hypothetical protein
VEKPEAPFFFEAIFQADEGELVKAVHKSLTASSGCFGHTLQKAFMSREKGDKEIRLPKFLDPHDDSRRYFSLHGSEQKKPFAMASHGKGQKAGKSI